MKNNNSKTKNSTRNTFYGFILKGFQLLMPFVVRTVIIKVLGMEYAGLNSLFVSILQILNIAELGVGFALVCSMYKPIEEDDTIKICALMRLYKIYYRIIGLVILAIGCAILPILPHLINGTYPSDINLYIIYLINLGATVLSYWLFAYKNSLFSAHQRNDIISKISLITDFIKYSIQIVVLFTIKNYYVFLIVLLFSQLLSNIATAIVANVFYPDYRAAGSLPKIERKKINASIRDLFFSQFGFVMTHSFDSISISIFLGLIPLAVYQNYYYILNAIIGFFTIFFQSCRASIGTNLITKQLEDNFSDLKFISFLIFGALSICMSCLATMYQPFIEIWVGSEYLLTYWHVVLFCIYLFAYEVYCLVTCYKDASGKWHYDRFRPLIASLVNLILNIILVNFIGLFGILLSTIVSFFFINIPWSFSRLFKDVFSEEQKNKYVVYIVKLSVLTLTIFTINIFACYFLPIQNLILKIAINFSISFIVSVLLYFLVLMKDESFKRFLMVLKRTLGRKTV